MASEEEIADQQQLLTTYRRTIARYLKQVAQLGEAHTPPGVFEGIRESRDNIHRIKIILRGWGVAVDQHPDDDESKDQSGAVTETSQYRHLIDKAELEAHERRLRLLRRKAAELGINAPVEILMEIEDIESILQGIYLPKDGISIIQRRLKYLREKYYYMGQNTPADILVEIDELEKTAKQLTETASQNQGHTVFVSISDDRRSLKVFLCHSSADKPAVRDLFHKLLKEGINPWLDEEDLLPGHEWQQEIPKAVRTSDVVIVCLSKSSISKAGYVQKEIRYALDVADEQPEGTIFIIPVKLEQCEVPERLKRWQWVNLFEERGYERLMTALQTRANMIGSSI